MTREIGYRIHTPVSLSQGEGTAALARLVEAGDKPPRYVVGMKSREPVSVIPARWL